MTKALLLIPSVLKTDIAAAVAEDQHPVMDYYALADALRTQHGMTVDIADHAAASADTTPAVRLAHKAGGQDASLAMLGWTRRRQYDAIFSNGENVGIPLALLLGLTGGGPDHVTIGHRLSAGKKRLFFQTLKAQKQMRTIFVYAQAQSDWATDTLGITPEKVSLIPFHADDRFYRPLPTVPDPNQICAAGLEWRDYPTLIDAVAGMPELSVKLAAASPWSKGRNETEGRTLPPNVDARRYDYAGLRDLYARSSFVVVPLYETDFQAGVTTILEAMAMGKAVIATRTTGQTDVIEDGVTGLTVAPGDVDGWRAAITRLRTDDTLRERLGRAARRWVEENATLDRWALRLAEAVYAASRPASGPADRAVRRSDAAAAP